jgi:hypothetical protein
MGIDPGAIDVTFVNGATKSVHASESLRRQTILQKDEVIYRLARLGY